MLSNKIGKIPYWLMRRVRRAFIVIGSLLMVELRGKMHDFFAPNQNSAKWHQCEGKRGKVQTLSFGKKKTLAGKPFRP